MQHKGHLRVRHSAQNVIDIQFRLLNFNFFTVTIHLLQFNGIVGSNPAGGMDVCLF